MKERGADMTLFKALLEKYGTNEPILSADIKFENYSRPWIMKQLQTLCEEGKIIRYEKGIYYIPTDTVFGKSILSPRKVIEKKYIKDGTEIMGYYSGITFQNQLKLTTQMSNVVEIFTNNETAKVRDIMVGKQKVTLRKARTTINNDNVAVLSFLELMNDITPRSLDDEKKAYIIDFINALYRRPIALKILIKQGFVANHHICICNFLGYLVIAQESVFLHLAELLKNIGIYKIVKHRLCVCKYDFHMTTPFLISIA